MIRLPRPRMLLALVAILAMAGGGIGLLAAIWSDHEATLDDWRLDLAVSARLMESHLRAVHAVSASELRRVEDRLAEHGLEAMRGSGSDAQWLQAVAAATPAGVAACVHDAKGILVLDSKPAAALCAFSAAERVNDALGHPGQVVINAILDDRLKPTHLVAFSKALESGAVVEILVGGEYFDDLYRKIQPPDQGSIFLIVRLDGVVVARHPMPPGPLFRFDTSLRPFTEFLKAEEGWLRSFSVVDGVERLNSFRRLPDLGVVVTSGMTVNMVFRDWTIRTQRNVGLFAGAMLLLLGLSAIANESLRHEGRLLRSMEQKTGELTAALEEKDVLFQEVHHRVKNNLQVISSLLTMQLLHVTDASARESLKDSLDRIASMGLVHQTLYEHNTAANVDLGVYFGRLAEALAGGYAARKGGVTIQVDVAGSLELERAVPLGMLANEALSNALKHAFPDGRPGTIFVSLAKDEANWRFSVRDDGIGMPERPIGGIGLSLIKALSRQLGGRSAISHDGGTVVIVTFPV